MMPPSTSPSPLSQSPVWPPQTLRTLQVGMRWFPVEGGSGLDRMFYGLLRSLPAAGVACHGLVTAPNADGLGRRSQSSEISPTDVATVTAFSPETASLPRRILALRRSLRHACADSAPDLIATHFALHALPLLGTHEWPPHVVHFHGPWALESAVEGESGWRVWIKRQLEAFIYRTGAGFIVLSDAFRSVLHRTYGVPESRIVVVPGGVDIDRFAPSVSQRDARLQLGWPTDRPILLTVRRLVRRVGLEPLLTAVKLLRRAHPDLLLLMAGKGALYGELERRIRDEGLSDNARLLGFLPDAHLPLAYHAADVSVMPTQFLEGFGLAAIESLAAGTPPIVTPVGGLPELLEPLSPNLVCEGTDAPSLAARIDSVLRGRIKLPSPDACRSYAKRHYDWPVIARNTKRAYQQILQ